MVRPGMTGWAQVRYRYANNLEEEIEKLRYDLYYVKHASVWLDLRILFETFAGVVTGSPARRHRAAHAATLPAAPCDPSASGSWRRGGQRERPGGTRSVHPARLALAGLAAPQVDRHRGVRTSSLAAVAAAALSLPDLYRASATVLVERQEVSEAFVRPSVTAELETRIQTIHQQVMSRAQVVGRDHPLRPLSGAAGPSCRSKRSSTGCGATSSRCS